MSVSGLAITLSERAPEADAALRALRTHGSIEIGALHGRRVAAVADTASPHEDRELWDWMHGLAGVEHVDVLFVHFDGQEEGQSS